MSSIESAILSKFTEFIVKELSDKMQKAKDVLLFKFSPSRISKTTLKRASATNTKWSDTPALTFTNPFKKDIKIKEISMVGDASFLTMGMVKIMIDEEILFESLEAGNFTDMPIGSDIKIIEGKTIKRDKEISVYLKTSTTVINLAVQITLGD